MHEEERFQQMVKRRGASPKAGGLFCKASGEHHYHCRAKSPEDVLRQWHPDPGHTRKSTTDFSNVSTICA